MAVNSAHADVLVHRHAKGKEAVELEVVAGLVDALDIEPNLEPEDGKARRQVNDLARHCAAGRLDPLDSAIRPGVVAGRIGQQVPDSSRRRGDGVSRTDVQTGT